MFVCPNCRSDKVGAQVVEKQKKRGCFALVMGSKTITFAVCHNCGYRWELKK